MADKKSLSKNNELLNYQSKKKASYLNIPQIISQQQNWDKLTALW